MSEKPEKPPMVYKCLLCGDYHEISIKEMLLALAFLAVLVVIFVLRSCGRV